MMRGVAIIGNFKKQYSEKTELELSEENVELFNNLVKSLSGKIPYKATKSKIEVTKMGNSLYNVVRPANFFDRFGQNKSKNVLQYSKFNKILPIDIKRSRWVDYSS